MKRRKQELFADQAVHHNAVLDELHDELSDRNPGEFNEAVGQLQECLYTAEDMFSGLDTRVSRIESEFDQEILEMKALLAHLAEKCGFKVKRF